MDKQSLPLVAFCPSDVDEPSFVTPVFGSDPEECYLQVLEDQRRVVGFERLVISPQMGLVSSKLKASTGLGQEPVFAFQFGPGDFVCDQKDRLTRVLRARLTDLQDFPFARLSVVSFLGDNGEIERAIDSVGTELCTVNRSLAVDWFSAISQRRHGPGRGQQPQKVAANWNEVQEFTLALLKFCRAQRNFSGGRSATKRSGALYTYARAFDRIIPFFFNTGFLSILRDKLRDIERQPMQFELSFLRDEDERIGSLTRLGMSRRAARRVLGEVSKTIRKEHGGARSRDPLTVLLKADNIIRNQVELSRNLTLAEKAVRKRQLEVGSISIAYGLLLLLRNNAEHHRAPDGRLDELAIAAIQSGLKNCAPPRSVLNESAEFHEMFDARRATS